MTAKTDVVVKLVLVFFISLLSFSIGTFVGKKYSDNQHKLASLEPGATEGTREVASEAHGQSEGSISDADIAKIAEEFADDDSKTVSSKGEGEEHGEKTDVKAQGEEPAKVATEQKEEHGGKIAKTEKTEKEAPTHAVVAAHAPAKENSHHEKEKSAHDEEPSEPAKNLAEGKRPTEPLAKTATKETRLPSSLPKDVAQYSVGKFTVQVASYGTEPEAVKRAEELKHQGLSAFYVPAQVKGKTWYRVSIGLFATEEEAKKYKKTDIGSKIEGTIIQKIAN